jgi:hypothetical protein
LTEQVIANQHAGLIAPDQPRRAPSPAQVAFVHHIVMQQGCRVHELDCRRQVDVVVALRITAHPGRCDGQHGTQPLAAGINQVLRKLRDQIDMRFGMLQNLRIDLLHVWRQPASRRGVRLASFASAALRGTTTPTTLLRRLKHQSRIRQ